MNISLTIITVLLFSIPSICQELITGEEILNRFIEETGGRMKQLQVKSVIMETEADIYGEKVQLKSYRIYPDKIKISMKQKGLETIKILNGQKTLESVNGIEKEMDKITELGLIEEALIFPDLYLIEQGCQIKNLGEKEYEKGYYEVQLILEDDRKRINYYSVQTGLLWKSIDVASNSSSYYLEYESFDGIKIPTKGKLRANGGEMEFNLRSYIINPEISENEFKIKPMPNNGEQQ